MPSTQDTSSTVKSLIFGAALAGLVPAAGTAQGFRTETLEGQLFFSLGPTYNRVEGLPITIGPVFRTRGEHQLRFQALAIVRAERDLPIDLFQVGFSIGAERDLGDHFAIGATGWSRLKWIENRGISNLESSLGAFVFHDDRRDYYDALGAGVHARFETFGTRLQGILSFRHERLRPMPTSGATSLLNNREPWRDQVLAADGTLHSLLTTVTWDDRPVQRDGPFNGWFAELEILAGLGGNYDYPPTTDVFGNPFNNFPIADNEPIKVTADVRRYFAFRDIEINLRVAGGGSVTNRPLVTQFQSTLGGVGSLPGLPLFQQDCGARQSVLIPTRNAIQAPFSPYYGCDRFVLGQAEIAGYFGFTIGGERRRGNAFRGPSGLGFKLVPQWVLFADAGQAWSLLDGFYTTVRDEKMRYDVGAGIVFGDVGVYVAYPLNLDKTPRFALRLIRRI